ncbi:hypothetical protein [Parvicella tangerina]|uniref:Uncharacterized protein n=1 Tax=Parvicella tangerina TaxID=2829795 RepID=A0A916JQV2_9FLAO|nr:hypothetical protein [Parvicella tangerina]CAG5086780.1 hypothetical protein CRYO30217_03275 [Parvicella tangerina]
MKTENKLSTLFKTREPQVKISDQLVDDPRIDSPEIKVIRPDEKQVEQVEVTTQLDKVEPIEEKPITKEVAVVKTSEEDKVYDQGFLEEFEVVADKKVETEEPHVCEVGFADAFKQNWMWLTALMLGLGVGCFLLGRITKKVS